MADDFILETKGLTKEFAGFVAVNDVNLQIKRGSIHALIGPNGAGKTTCFNLLTKFLTPSRGQILYKGQDITARYGGEEFAVVLPSTGLRQALTVADHIRRAVMAKELKKKSTGEILGRVTISVGVSILKSTDDTDSLIERADACLYAAKRNGRNRVVCEADPEYSPTDHIQVA